ncbi:MAG: hypothetical protein ACT4PZ_16670 [Panacagrimonas sp.]
MKSQALDSSRIGRRKKRTETVAELDFNDDGIPPRTGDPIDAEDLSNMLPRRRGRQAGLTGASVADDVTADDLSPETLIDEDGPDSTVRRRSGPVDTVLRRLSEEEVFADPEHEPAGDDEDREETGARPS